ASPSVACRRRFWREGSAVRHTPIRHPSNHSDISSDRDRTSLDSCPSTSKVPPNRPQKQWITRDSRESRSSRTDTKVIAPWPHMPNIQLVQGTEQVLPTAMIRYMVV